MAMAVFAALALAVAAGGYFAGGVWGAASMSLYQIAPE